jgi:hypothetical protein
MTSQAEVDGKRYCDLMEEVKLRIDVVNHFLSGQGDALYQPATLETVCLQIRKILELVAFGSLVANKEAYTATYAKVSKAWNAGEILAELAKVNPNFYPVPIIEVQSEIPGVRSRHKKRVGDYLDEEEFKEVYGRCGVLAHAANPYGKGIDYKYYARSLPVWRTRIMNLLNAHSIYLLGDPGMYLVHMSEHGNDRVKLYRFQPPPLDLLRKVGFDGDRSQTNRMTARQIEELIKLSRSQ